MLVGLPCVKVIHSVVLNEKKKKSIGTCKNMDTVDIGPCEQEGCCVLQQKLREEVKQR